MPGSLSNLNDLMHPQDEAGYDSRKGRNTRLKEEARAGSKRGISKEFESIRIHGAFFKLCIVKPHQQSGEPTSGPAECVSFFSL